MAPAQISSEARGRRCPRSCGRSPDVVMRTTVYASPIGLIEIRGSEKGIVYLGFKSRRAAAGPPRSLPAAHPGLRKCVRQLDEYFCGRRRTFSLKLDLNGTEFQEKVWKEVAGIPYGRTATYKDIARSVGKEKAVRAVGGANHANPIPIIVPCHRVVGSGGKLTGYGGGLWRKYWLLEHERTGGGPARSRVETLSRKKISL